MKKIVIDNSFIYFGKLLKNTYVLSNLGVIVFMILTLSDKPDFKLLIIVNLSLLLAYFYQVFYSSASIISDIRFYFIVFFQIYHLFVPFVFSMFPSQYLNYPRISMGINVLAWSYSSDTVIKALIATAIYTLGLVISNVFFYPLVRDTKENHQMRIRLLSKNISSTETYFWMTLTALAFFWYIFPYTKDFLLLVSISRVYRATIISNTISSLGIVGRVANLLLAKQLIWIGLVISFRGSFLANNSRLQRFICILLLSAVLLFFFFVDLRRVESLVVLIALLVILLEERLGLHKNLKSTKKLFLIVIVVFLVLLISMIYFETFRGILILAYSSGMKNATSGNNNPLRFRIDTEMSFYTTEFAGPYLTLLASIAYPPSQLLGKSYLESVPMSIPFLSNILTEFFDYRDKTPSVYVWLSDVYYEVFSMGGGLGFTPVAEAYVNLGFFGCLFFGFAVGLVFNALARSTHSVKEVSLHYLLLPMGFLFNRGPFVFLFSNIFFMIMYYVIYKALYRIFFRRGV
jgi:hypothetical protein